MAKKYDIMVYDVDDEGNQLPPEHINGVMAPGPRELMQLYGACGQQVKIVREYEDEESKGYGKLVVDDTAPAPGVSVMKAPTEEAKQALINSQAIQNKPSPQQPKSASAVTTSTKSVNEPPKVFTVGGIKCKLENGKMYQKQWIALNEEESKEIRIVSDKNNKIFQLKDKHIEIMKWILVEDKSDGNGDKELILG